MTLTECSRGIRRAVSNLLPHNNQRCIAPPGIIRPAGGKPILVPSLMRSGTHVLIDLLLNNFPAYRRTPLYVDLDHYLARGHSLDALKQGGSYVIKTHYPNSAYTAEATAALEDLIHNAFIIRPVREIDDIRRSQATWGMAGALEFDRTVEAFGKFWGDVPKLYVPVKDLVDPKKCTELIQRIADYIGQSPQQPPILPPLKEATAQVLLAKALTRLLGRRAPVINTTIGFALTDDKARRA